MQASLIRVTDEGEAGEIPIASGRTLIGRQDHCEIRIPKSDVSREHCEIVADEDSGISIKDLGSSNGTYVNRERVEVRDLAAGDLLSIGGLVFVLRIDGHPQQIDAALCYEDGLPDPTHKSGAGGGAGGGRPTSSSSKPQPSKASTPEPPTQPSGLLKDEFGELGGDLDGSSMLEFDFDLDDDELESQPEL